MEIPEDRREVLAVLGRHVLDRLLGEPAGQTDDLPDLLDRAHAPGADGQVRLDAAETLDVIREALTRLPNAQREVVTLRDLEGWSATEVCNALDITETNQRVLLHRGRSKLRATLELYFETTNQ